MKMRFAKDQDVHPIAELAFKWAREMGHNVDKQRVLEEIIHVLSIGRMFIIEHKDEIVGILGVRIVHPVWNGHKVCHEHYMFVDPKARGGHILELMRSAIEAWAKQNGCQEVSFHPNVFGAPRLDALTQYFIRKGYVMTGYEVTKEI